MPGQQGVRLDDHKNLLPVGDAANQDQEPETVTRGKGRSFDLALQNGELLAQERILGNQVHFEARKIAECAQQDRRLGRDGPASEGLVHEGKTTLLEFFEESKGKAHARFFFY